MYLYHLGKCYLQHEHIQKGTLLFSHKLYPWRELVLQKRKEKKWPSRKHLPIYLVINYLIERPFSLGFLDRESYGNAKRTDGEVLTNIFTGKGPFCQSCLITSAGIKRSSLFLEKYSYGVEKFGYLSLSLAVFKQRHFRSLPSQRRKSQVQSFGRRIFWSSLSSSFYLFGSVSFLVSFLFMQTLENRLRRPNPPPSNLNSAPLSLEFQLLKCQQKLINFFGLPNPEGESHYLRHFKIAKQINLSNAIWISGLARSHPSDFSRFNHSLPTILVRHLLQTPASSSVRPRWSQIPGWTGRREWTSTLYLW